MDITQLQQQAYEYLGQGQYSEAIALYERCIEANPTWMSNYWHLGLAWFLQEETLEAESVWLSVIAQGTPEEVDVWMAELVVVLEAEAIRYFQTGNLQPAEGIYWQILELAPNHTQAYYNLGTVLGHLEKWDEAGACLQRAIDLKPDFVEAYHNLGYVFQNQGNFEKAISFYLKALEITPYWSDIYYELGRCLARQDKLDEAIANFQKATQIQPDYLTAYCECSDALLKRSKLDEAIACFQQIIQIKPDFVQAYCNWRDTLVKQGNIDDEINSNANFLKALQRQQISAYTYFYIGNKLARNQKWSEAIDCYRKALKINPDYAEVYFELGMSFAHQNNTDQAIICFQKALEINQNLTEKVQYHLETALQKKGKQDEINPCFQQPPLVNQAKGFYESTRDWAVTFDLDKSKYIEISPRHQIYLPQPRTIYGIVPFCLQETQFESPETFVTVIPEGRAWVSSYANAIITSDNLLLADVSPYFPVSHPAFPNQDYSRKHPILSDANLPSVNNIDGIVVVLPGLGGNNYFHWMIDILPSIEFLYRSGIDITGIDKFLINGYCQLPFQKEILDTLGIPLAKILESDKYPLVKANNLIVPSLPGHLTWITKGTCEFIRNLFLPQINIPKTQKKERIYISRKQAKYRRVINEEAAVKFLQKFGFRSVTLESLSFTEQVSLLARAEVVISPHGAGLTNTIFCSPGTKVIEIFPKNAVWPYFWAISTQVGLEYYFLAGEGIECSYLRDIMYGRIENEDILINIDSLLEVIKFAELV